MKNKKTVTLATVVIAIVVLAAVVMAFAVPKGEKIAAGVKIGGIKVGKMTAKEAEEKLLSSLGESPSGEVTIVLDGVKKQIGVGDKEMSFDFSKSVKAGYDIGRGKNVISNGFTGLKAILGGVNIPVSIVYDNEKLEAAVSDAMKDMGTPVSEYSYELLDDAIVITNGTPGDIPDAKVVAAEIVKAVGLGRQDKVLKYKKGERAPSDVDIDELLKKLGSEAKDAQYVVENGNVTVTEHSVGVELDVPEAKKTVAANKEYGATYKIPAKVYKPKLTYEDAKARLFSNVLASYSTKYNAGDTSRSHNIALAASSINGVILAPGDVFSYNGVVGERTAERGYKNAKVFMNGESVDGIGGGICQVSTTLYSAALYANLKMVERTNHQLPVSYAPLGQDATVFFGSIDFKFENNTNYPIKIVASANRGTMYVEIQGYKEDKSLKVSVEHATVSVTEPKVKEIEDDTLPEGETKVKKKGSPGYVVDTYKTVTRDGAEPVRTRISRSAYGATAEEVLIGTGKAVEGENASEEVEETEETDDAKETVTGEANVTAGASTLIDERE